MQLTRENNFFRLTDFGSFNFALSLDCGQAFRWSVLPDGSCHGVAGDRVLTLSGDDKSLEFHDTTEADIKDFWLDYLGLNDDYDSIISEISADWEIRTQAEQYGSIRILRQQPWEALCSFIISACNNIPRIKGIINRLCENFGDNLGNGDFSFPSAERIAGLSAEDLSCLRAGFRVPYILDAAEKTASGKLLLSEIAHFELSEAEKALMQINGVGLKVADCTLLFGLGRLDAFPVDRHIKRISAQMYPQGLPDCFKNYAGVAQQYMFCAARGM